MIKSNQISELRTRTGAGILDCKRALTAAAGDLTGAINWLREQGLAAAAKRTGRVAAEGLIAVASNANHAVAIELNCETDFVARNDNFRSLATSIAKHALTQPDDLAELLASKMDDASIQDRITELVAKIGENIQLRRLKHIRADEGYVVSYLHAPAAPNLGNIAAVIAIRSDAKNIKIPELGKQLAMQIAAQNPQWLSSEDVDEETRLQERKIIAAQSDLVGKPEAILEKIVDGRMKKFYAQHCLLQQTSIFDNKQTIASLIKQTCDEIGAKLIVTNFTRLAVGEGVATNGVSANASV